MATQGTIPFRSHKSQKVPEEEKGSQRGLGRMFSEVWSLKQNYNKFQDKLSYMGNSVSKKKKIKETVLTVDTICKVGINSISLCKTFLKRNGGTPKLREKTTM